MKKRVLSLFLLLCMVVSLMPVLAAPASAEEEAYDYETLYVQDGLKLFVSAYKTDTSGVDIASGKWSGKGSLTLTGGAYSDSNKTGWQALADGGISYYLRNLSEFNSKRYTTGMWLDNSVLGDGDFTVETVFDPRGVVDEAGNRYIHSSVWQGDTVEGESVWGLYNPDGSNFSFAGLQLCQFHKSSSTSGASMHTRIFYWPGQWGYTYAKYGKSPQGYGGSYQSGDPFNNKETNDFHDGIYTMSVTRGVYMDGGNGYMESDFCAYISTSFLESKSFVMNNTGTQCAAKEFLTVDNINTGSSGETKNHAYTLFYGFPAVVYAVRAYDRVLTVHERQQNHFADLAAYFALDMTGFDVLQQVYKNQLYVTFAAFTFQSDREDLQAAITAMVGKTDDTADYSAYYVQDGLRFLADAFDNTTPTLDLENGRWYNKVGAGYATIAGALYNAENTDDMGWFRKEGGGFGYNMTATQVKNKAAAGNRVSLPNEYLHEGSFTFEEVVKLYGFGTDDAPGANDVAYNTGTTNIMAGGWNFWHFRPLEYRLVYSANGWEHGPTWVKDGASNIGNQEITTHSVAAWRSAGIRYIYTEKEDGEYVFSNALNGYRKPEELPKFRQEESEDGTISYVQDNVNGTYVEKSLKSGNNAATYELLSGLKRYERTEGPTDLLYSSLLFYKNQNKVWENSLYSLINGDRQEWTKPKYYQNNVSQSLLFTMQNIAGTVYAIRVYDHVLSDAERAQNYFVDIAAYFTLNLAGVETMPETFAQELYASFSSYTFNDSAKKAEMQEKIDSAVAISTVAGTALAYEGLSARLTEHSGIRSAWKVDNAKIQVLEEAGYTVSYGAIMGLSKVYASSSALTVEESAGKAVVTVYANGTYTGKVLTCTETETTFANTTVFNAEEATKTNYELGLVYRGFVKLEKDGVSTIFYTDMSGDAFPASGVSCYDVAAYFLANGYEGNAVLQAVLDACK